MIGPRRDASCDRGSELRGIQTPLLACVVAEEFLVEIPPDGVDDHVFTGSDLRARFAHPLVKSLNGFLVKIEVIDSIYCVYIDGNRYKFRADFGEHMVLIRSPLRKLRQV